MGGLVCRCFLQNPRHGSGEARKCVDKVFTYATPHNGIDMAGINVPKWLTADQINTFNRRNMSRYLNLESEFEQTGRVDWLPETPTLSSRRFFCMIGTNRDDYQAAMGLSRTFAGHGSDGLVAIENASVWGRTPSGEVSEPTATAYTFRSHSGWFGIVNSEEAYQNLKRFLFGDLRVDIWVDIQKDSVRLPPGLEGQKVDGLYQFEILTAPRGKRWYLSRRVAEEDSVACLRHTELMASKRPTTGIYLSTVFLSDISKVDPLDPFLTYGLTFGVRVPDYEVENRLWFNSHYEGAYLFRDALAVAIKPPVNDSGEWSVKCDWLSSNPGPPATALPLTLRDDGRAELVVDFNSNGAPGISGSLRFVVSPWND
jgi:hypothetical protein